MRYEIPEVVEIGQAEELTLGGSCGCECDCACGYRCPCGCGDVIFLV